MPTDTFWEGVGKSIEHASGDIVVAGVVVAAVVFLIVKYYLPERSDRIKFESEMRQKRLELEVKQQQDSADIQRRNLEQKGRELEILSGVQATQETLVTMVGDVNVNLQLLIERIEGSKQHSQSLVAGQGKLQEDVSVIRDQVDDIHKVLYKPVSKGE